MSNTKDCNVCIHKEVCIKYKAIYSLLDTHFNTRTFMNKTGQWPNVTLFYKAAAECCINYDSGAVS